MYTPPAFAEPRPDRVLGLVEAHDFATLVHADGTDVALTHAPVFLHTPRRAAEATAVEGATLELHLARANALCRRLEQVPRLTVAVLQHLASRYPGLDTTPYEAQLKALPPSDEGPEGASRAPPAKPVDFMSESERL